MDTPILDMIFSRPLPRALSRLASAFFSVSFGSPAMTPRRTRSRDRLDGQVGVDGSGAVADEQRDVVALAGVPRLDDQAGPGPRLLPDQMVVHGAGQQQRRDRGQRRRR